jgi:hypothetical protein
MAQLVTPGLKCMQLAHLPGSARLEPLLDKVLAR